MLSGEMPSTKNKIFRMRELLKKGEECKTVPWRDWVEWVCVYNLVISEDYADMFLAVETMQKWYCRGKLPLSLDATLGFLTIMSQDDVFVDKGSKCTIPNTLLVMMYGQAVTRFVNLLIDSVQDGAIALSMEKLAISLNIPSWIIQCRHSVTHGHSPPTLDTLRHAAKYLLREYVVPRYWLAQRSLIPETCLKVSKPVLLSGKTLIESYFDDLSDISALSIDDISCILDGSTIHWIVRLSGDRLQHNQSKMRTILEMIVHTDKFEALIEQMMYYENTELLGIALMIPATAAYTRNIIISKSGSDHCRMSLERNAELLAMQPSK